MKHSIRTKLMRAFMLLLCAFVAFSSILTLLGMHSLRSAVDKSAKQLSSLASRSSYETIVSQALDFAGSYATEKALTISQALQVYITASAELADFTAYLFEHPDDFKALPVPTPAELMAAGAAAEPALQYIPAIADVTGVEAETENALLGNLRSAFSTVYTNLPGINSIYTAHESGANIGYDANAALKVDTPTLDCRAFSWYTAAKSAGSLYVSPPYQDHFGRGLTITLAQPIIVNGAFNGVLGVDILIERISSEIQNARYGKNGYALLLDGSGGIIAAGGQSVSAAGTIFNADILDAMQTKNNGYIKSQIADQVVYLLFAPVPSVGWKLMLVTPEDDMLAAAAADDAEIAAISEQTLAEMDRISNRISLIMAGLFAVLAAIAVFVVRGVSSHVSKPILALSKQVDSISEGQLTYHANIHTGDEVELLDRRFEEMTGSLREYIAHLTRVTAEKERLSAELSIAAKIQTSALPRVFPVHTVYSLYAMMLPAKEVGGDFYDFFAVDDDHIMLVIADVSGKGIPAALFMMTTKTLLQTFAKTGIPPAAVLDEVNRQLCENNEAGMFVTAWIGLYQLSTGQLVYANAGHNPPYLRRACEEFSPITARPGFVLAGIESIHYTQIEITLKPGDLLFLYTDGVTEATNASGQLYGEKRLQTTLNQLATSELPSLLAGVKADIDLFTAGEPQFDDITMLALRITGGDDCE